MKQILQYAAAVLVAVALAYPAEAKIWRVNNNGFNADYATVQAANDDPNVLPGDTIHVEGSSIRYYPVIFNKKLVIIGAGYFLADNPKTSNNLLQSDIASVGFIFGSEGSTLEGIHISGSVGLSYASIDINASDITITRCLIDYRIFLGNYNANNTNIRITQNYFSGKVSGIFSYSNNISGDPYFPSYVYFNNNICKEAINLPDHSSAVITECNNNVIDAASQAVVMYAASFKNNIIIDPTATVKINGITDFNTNPTSLVSHNISSSAVVHFGTANNNIVVNNIASTLFIGGTSSDGKYKLKSGSPGSGNGSDGTDRGAFGGAAVSNRYSLSGLAPIPVIYEISTTGVATPGTGLNVTIKARVVE